MSFADDLWNMSLALEESEKAYRIDEVPIGAVIVDENDKILAKTYNLKEQTHDPLGHAEILAIKAAAKVISNWRLSGCTLYVTCEPCPMCLAAMVQARIKTLIFGAYDPKGGALSLGYDLYKDERLNHKFNVQGGLKSFECSRLLSQFFKEKRADFNRKKKINA
jgi:tRNA(adenine34) deaminase